MVDRRRQRARWFFPGVAGVLLVGALTFALPDGGPVTFPPTGSLPPWTMHTIVAGVAGGGNPDGADGVTMLDVDGDGLLDVATGHEQGSVVTLSFNPGSVGNLVESPWPTVTLVPTCSPEDVAIADVDADGALDLVAACETGTNVVQVFFAPAPPVTRSNLLNPVNWTKVELTASATLGRAMRVLVANIAGDAALEIVTGGKESDGPPEASALGYYSSATPRTGGSWTFTSIVPVGWVMQMYVQDFNGDTDLDIVYSDRDPINTPSLDNSKRGVRWLDNNGSAVFTERQISTVEPDHKWFSLLDWDGDTDLDVLDCRSTPGTNISQVFINGGGGTSWSTQSVPQPGNVGLCQHATNVDFNLDGVMDLFFSYSNAALLSGLAGWKNVTALPNLTLTRLEVAGVLAAVDTKFDNIYWEDVDDDGDPDVVATEQHIPNGNGPGLGVVYFENPTVAFVPAVAPPAISCARLDSGYSAAGGTTLNTNSVSPGANRLEVLAVQSALAGGPALPSSVVGNGLTWVQIQTLQYHTTNTRRLTLYRAMGAAPSSGAATITWAASQTAMSWAYIECSGVDTGGTNGSAAVVQNATTTVTGTTTLTNTLATLGAATAVHLGFVAAALSTTVTPDTDFAELSDNGGATGAQTLESEWATNQTAMTATFGSGNAGAISIEVKISP